MSDVESNRSTAIEFFDLVFNQKRLDLAFERCIGPTYTQHNPAVADGRDGLAEFVGNLLAEFPDFTTHVVRTVAEGDLVRCTSLPGDFATTPAWCRWTSLGARTAESSSTGT